MAVPAAASATQLLELPPAKTEMYRVTVTVGCGAAVWPVPGETVVVTVTVGCGDPR